MKLDFPRKTAGMALSPPPTLEVPKIKAFLEALETEIEQMPTIESDAFKSTKAVVKLS